MTAAHDGLRLPEFGLGGGPLGNLFHAIGDEEAHATVDAAWQSGVRFFDTAPHYGLGLAERRDTVLHVLLRHELVTRGQVLPIEDVLKVPPNEFLVGHRHGSPSQS